VERGHGAFPEKNVEYALAALHGKKGKVAFLNFLTQISPACDCYGHSDAPIVHDLGIMASVDPVAIDQASVDMVTGRKALEGTSLAANKNSGEDKFGALYQRWTGAYSWCMGKDRFGFAPV